MRLAEFLPEFTEELCSALRTSGDRHLAEQIERSSVHASSYDSDSQIGTLGLESQGLSLTAEANIVESQPGRRSVSVSRPQVVIDIDNFGLVHGLEVFAASSLTSELSSLRI